MLQVAGLVVCTDNRVLGASDRFALVCKLHAALVLLCLCSTFCLHATASILIVLLLCLNQGCWCCDAHKAGDQRGG